MGERAALSLDESLWGKSRGLERPYPLVWHLLDAAGMASYLWGHYLSNGQRRCITRDLGLDGDLERARGLVALAAGLHDIGKISGFQMCDRRGQQGLSARLADDLGEIGVERLGHDVAGMEAAPVLLAALGLGNADRAEFVRRFAQCLGGHHGRFHRLDLARVGNPHHAGLLGGREWAEQRAAHAAGIYDILGAPDLAEQFKAPGAVLVTGLVMLADWLVSQEHYLRDRQDHPAPDLAAHFAAACAAAGPLVAEAGLEPVGLDRKAFAQAYGIEGEPNPLQRSVIEELPGAAGGNGAGILVVTAAPGDGKTEAALEAERILAAACGTRGFAFLLPTMATSDQMYDRVSGAVARQGGAGAGLTLTHSMAWLNQAYTDEELTAGAAVLSGHEAEEDGADRSEERQAGEWVKAPTRWLRGAKRPLLAQFTVGTVDQALMAVLPVRHNALRMLALTGKTFIVDEAHAYDPYMQVLLGRLLNWLGWYGVPVVLLSATLPRSVSDQLIRQYLSGAGHRRAALRGRSFEVPYPGWLFVSARTGRCTAISSGRQRAQAKERRIQLRVAREGVRHVHPEAPGLSAEERARTRLAVIERLVAPALAGRGCVLVVCNTVPQAQETYSWLEGRFGLTGSRAGEIALLHARFPADDREERTREITKGLGRKGPRPVRRILVATQVVEQSLDLDADLVISDLAPLALLLQRAGRCWRHEAAWSRLGYPDPDGRPAWAEKTGPQLVVLDPLVNGGAVPKQWGEVYSELLLRATSDQLAARGDKPMVVPDEVQDLVEEVHGDLAERYAWGDPAGATAWSAHQGTIMAMQSAGRSVAIPSARAVRNLEELHHLDGTEEEWEASTRLGAESVRLLCAYDHGDRITLDLAGKQRLPEADRDGNLAVADVRAVMRRTMPVPAKWFVTADDALLPPPDWREHPLLADLVVLRQPVHEGRVVPVPVGGKTMYLDEDRGLVRS